MPVLDTGAFIAVGGPQTGGGSVNPQPVAELSGAVHIIDGTPVRVVILAVAAAAGLAALRLGGFRFNVGVTS